MNMDFYLPLVGWLRKRDPMCPCWKHDLKIYKGKEYIRIRKRRKNLTEYK